MLAPLPTVVMKTTSNKRRVRILAISRAYGENAGGMERLSYELLEALEQDPTIELVRVVNPTQPHQSLSQARWRSVWFALTATPRALTLARHADVIHLGDPVLSLIGWLIQRVFQKPVAVTVHGLDLLYAARLYQLYLRLFFRHFNTYIPISTQAARALKKHSVSGTIRIIHPGIKDRFYAPQLMREALEELVKRPLTGYRTLLTVGRLVPRKGHVWFIKNVLPSLPLNTLYIIAGDGPEREKIERIVGSAENPYQNVVVLGRTSDSNLRTLYNTVDAFIQPNLPTPNDSEGFGLVVIEAALCERPVFASNLEGISEAISDGKNGTLLPAGDAHAWQQTLAAFLTNPTLVPTARTYTLERFAWSHQARQYAQLLQSLASHKY